MWGTSSLHVKRTGDFGNAEVARVPQARRRILAADAEQAIKVAISHYEIKSASEQARLAAQRVREIG